SNLSKNDLEDICQNFGLPTEGVKADLVQRLKIHSARLLANLVLLNLTNNILVERDYADNDEDTHITGGENYVNDLEIGKEEGLMVSELRNLRSIMAGFDNKLNSVTAQ
ncbi:17684_t:CDS:2, partial [Racocetra persica]